MIHRILNISESQSFFLFGARGTGKSTFIREELLTENSIYIDLLKFSELSRFKDDPEELERRIAPETDWVAIDEIQKAPALLDTVHYLIEDKSIKAKFAMSGSSARKLKLGGANLLAGRAFVYNLFPFSALELGEDFVLNQALAWGVLPGIHKFKDVNDKKIFLETYANTYLKEEIWDEHLVKELSPFRRFLQVAAQCNGTVLNYSSVARDVRIDTKTVQRYFEILEDTLICQMLEPYSPSLRKRQRANPKCYFIDLGIVAALTGSFHLEITPISLGYGYLFEHFIILEFIKRNSYYRKNFQFSFIRDEKGREVDLVVERPGENTLLIEIKSGDRVREKYLEGVRHFLGVFPNCEGYVVSRDKIRQEFGQGQKGSEVKCVYWKEIFEEIGLS